MSKRMPEKVKKRIERLYKQREKNRTNAKEMQRILLVYPRIPTTYWSYKYALPFIGKKATMPPLGLLTVASMLPESCDIRLVDMNVSHYLQEYVEASDIVFLSAMIAQKPSFERVVKLCNDENKPVVAGGPYPTSCSKQIRGVDYFVLDEAELTLPAFLRDLAEGKPKGIYRDIGKPDITRTPVPRFDLIDVKAYASMPLQYSRGCPFNCEFCDIIELYGRGVRTKRPEQFIREMEAVKRTGFRGSLLIVDDNFVGNKKRVKDLLREMIPWQKRNRYPYRLSTEASIDLAQDNELLDLMVDAGFDTVFVGIETPDETTLAYTQKKQNLRISMLDSIKKIQQRGIEVTGGFIVGFDSDPVDIFQRQIDFIRESAIPMAMTGLLTALPNTQLFRRLEREKRLCAESSGTFTHELKLNFIPKMPLQNVINGYKHIISEIYSPKAYFERSLSFIKRLSSRSNSMRHILRISKTDIRALLLSMAKQSLTSYGFRYLHFLFQVLRTDPGNLSWAITLSIIGHHFFIITRQTLSADELSSLLKSTMQTIQDRLDDTSLLYSRRIAAELKAYTTKTAKQLQRKYLKLSRDMPGHIRDTFRDFKSLCDRADTILKSVLQTKRGSPARQATGLS
jgi:radical SAM superfamily enzyme YgiQ (UPF0313 family)